MRLSPLVMQIYRLGRRGLACLMLGWVTPQAMANPAVAALAVHNETPLSPPALQLLLQDHLSPEQRRWLSQSGVLLYVNATRHRSHRGENLCHAYLGLSTPPPRGQSVRWPAQLYHGARWQPGQGELSPSEVHTCLNQAIADALDHLMQDEPEAWMSGIELTRPEPPSSTRGLGLDLSPLYTTLPEALRSAFVAKVPHTLARQVEQKQAQWLVMAHAFRTADQRVACFALVGLTSRPPPGRTPHHPSTWSHAVQTLSGELAQVEQAETICREGAALKALESRLLKRWDDTGLFQGLDMTRERPGAVSR